MNDVELYNGNCFDVMKDFEDKSIDLIVTDPPYWHKKSPGKPYAERHQCNTNSMFSNSDLYNSDGYMMKGMSDFDGQHINAFLDEARRVMKIMNVYVFCSEVQVPYYCMWAERHKLMFSIMVWEKPLSIINKNRFSQNLEYIVRVYDYGTGLNRLAENEFYNRVRKAVPVRGKDKHHPTEKPTDLITPFIRLSSKENDIVLDPFMGSGSTGVVCVENKRKFIGVELNEDYFHIAEKRLRDAKHNKIQSLFDE